MPDIRIEREFGVTPETLFRVVTEQADILNWWGYDGMTFPDYALDLTREGAWHFVMVGEAGKRFKLSGRVTHVNPPRSVGFTWAWHDEEDKRGPESHVTYTIDRTENGARLTIDHRDLASAYIAAEHEAGWTGGPLPRLERYIASLGR